MKKKRIPLNVAESYVHELAIENKFFDRNYDDLKSLIKKKPQLVSFLPEKDRTLDILLTAFYASPRWFKDHFNEEWIDKLFLTNSEYLSKDEIKQLNLFQGNELTEMVLSNPRLISYLYPESFTHDLVKKHLAKMVSENRADLIDFHCKIPEEYRDKTFYQSYCMVHGYNYTRVPKEKRKEYFTEELILYTLDHCSAFVSAAHMVEVIPQDMITEKIALKLCLSHFFCIMHIPEKYKTEDFFDRLIAKGQYSCFDPKMTENQIITCLKHCSPSGNTEFLKIVMTPKIAEAVVLNANIHEPLKYIPKKYYNRSLMENYMRSHGCDIDKVPREYVDEDLCILAYQSHPFACMKHIPDEFKTENFYKEIKKAHFYPKDIPIKYLTEADMISYIKSEKGHIEITELPIITDKITHILSEYHPEDYIYPDEEHCRNALNQAKTILQKLNILKDCSVQPYDICYDLVTKASSAIEVIKNPKRELWRLSIEAFPENALKAPDWYFDGLLEDLFNAMEEETVPYESGISDKEQINNSLSDIDISSFSLNGQLSLFDFLH